MQIASNRVSRAYLFTSKISQFGQSAEYAKTVTEADILLFSPYLATTTRCIWNAEYAENSMFKSRIAHGMLSAGFISAVLGTRLPGEAPSPGPDAEVQAPRCALATP